jgi:hypothetical protein
MAEVEGGCQFACSGTEILFGNRCVFCFGFMFGNRSVRDESRSTTEVPLYADHTSRFRRDSPGFCILSRPIE